MTRKHVAGTRSRATALPGTGRATAVAGLSLFQLVALWRLHRGGITIPDAMKLMSLKIHAGAARGAVESLDTLMTSALPIDGHVRCGGCGALLVQVPCLACRGKRESYRISERNHG